MSGKIIHTAVQINGEAIHRIACQIIENCGFEHSEEYALSMIWVMRDRGDIDGAAVWANIWNDIKELINDDGGEDEGND